MEKKLKKLAVIGGSGIYSAEGFESIKEFEIVTPFGAPSGPIKELSLRQNRDITFFFLPRHGYDHQYNPSEVNYLANIYALKQLDADAILSISAVGSLREDLCPTTFVLPNQFFDATKGLRKRSFFSNGMLAHISCAHPIFIPWQHDLYRILKADQQNSHAQTSMGGTYICIEGPQFSSRSESLMYRQWGMDIIGMTNVPESYLAAEAAMAYVTIAMVTDYDCWREDSFCTVDEIMKVMQANNSRIQTQLPKIIERFYDSEYAFPVHNHMGFMTPTSKLNQSQKNIVDTLIGMKNLQGR